MTRECIDDNLKVVKRTYQWDSKSIEILLCKEHCIDPDFAYFESEEKIK